MHRLLILLLITSCSTTSNKIVIPEYSCKPQEIKLEFQEAKTLDEVLKNQELASLYYYQQQEQMQNSVICYEHIIEELNK